MSRVKIALAAIVSLFVCLTCASCKDSKSDKIQFIENQISQVKTFSDWWLALNIEQQYAALSEEDKQRVSNYADLEEMLDTVREAQAYAGDWKVERLGVSNPREFTLQRENGDVSFEWKGVGGSYWIRDGVFYMSGEQFGTVYVEDEIPKILMDGVAYVQTSNLERARQLKYVTVNLSSENVNDYFDSPVWVADDDGGFVKKVYCFPSKQYQNGLTYIGCSDDFNVTYIGEENAAGETVEWQPALPLPFELLFVTNNDTKPLFVKADAAGELYYIRSEYVKENYLDEDESLGVGARFLVLADGQVFSAPSSWRYYPEKYDEFKF